MFEGLTTNRGEEETSNSLRIQTSVDLPTRTHLCWSHGNVEWFSNELTFTEEVRRIFSPISESLVSQSISNVATINWKIHLGVLSSILLMTHNPYLSLKMQHNDYTGKHISTVFSPTCICPYTSCARSSYLISVLQAFGLESVFANKCYKIISIIHPFPSTDGSRPSYHLHCFQALQSVPRPNGISSQVVEAFKRRYDPWTASVGSLNTKEKWLNYIPRHLPSSQWMSQSFTIKSQRSWSVSSLYDPICQAATWVLSCERFVY